MSANQIESSMIERKWKVYVFPISFKLRLKIHFTWDEGIYGSMGNKIFFLDIYMSAGKTTTSIYVYIDNILRKRAYMSSRRNIYKLILVRTQLSNHEPCWKFQRVLFKTLHICRVVQRQTIHIFSTLQENISMQLMERVDTWNLNCRKDARRKENKGNIVYSLDIVGEIQQNKKYHVHKTMFVWIVIFSTDEDISSFLPWNLLQ